MLYIFDTIRENDNTPFKAIIYGTQKNGIIYRQDNHCSVGTVINHIPTEVFHGPKTTEVFLLKAKYFKQSCTG